MDQHHKAAVKLMPLSQWIPVRLVCYALGIMGAAVVATLVTRLLVPPAPSPWHQLVLIKNALLPFLMLATYGTLVRLLENRSAEEIDTRKGTLAFAIGGLIGTALMTAFFLILWGFGLARITVGSGFEGIANELLVPFLTAVGEELLFRIVLFRLVEAMTGTSVSMLVSAAVFGLSHAANPGATVFTMTTLSLEAGVMLALAYVLTRNIWLAVGIHMSWNLTQSWLFGASNSGLRDPHSLFQTTFSGPAILTGGTFGPEGSILTLALSLVCSGVLIALIRSRPGNWQPLRFQLGVSAS